MQPDFGQPQNANPYAIPQPGTPKKTMLLMAGGVVILLLIVGWLFFGGGSSAGETELRSGVQSTADAVAITDEYAKELTKADVQNDVALVQILLRGNFQTLNNMYNKSYKPKKKISATPKLDKTSQSTLAAAQRNNVLDSEIIQVLRPKVQAANKQLAQAELLMTTKKDKQVVKDAREDLVAIDAILDKAR